MKLLLFEKPANVLVERDLSNGLEQSLLIAGQIVAAGVQLLQETQNPAVILLFEFLAKSLDFPEGFFGDFLQVEVEGVGTVVQHGLLLSKGEEGFGAVLLAHGDFELTDLVLETLVHYNYLLKC